MPSPSLHLRHRGGRIKNTPNGNWSQSNTFPWKIASCLRSVCQFQPDVVTAIAFAVYSQGFFRGTCANIQISAGILHFLVPAGFLLDFYLSKGKNKGATFSSSSSYTQILSTLFSSLSISIHPLMCISIYLCRYICRYSFIVVIQIKDT